MSELVRRVAQIAREKESVTREDFKKNQHAWAHACSMVLALPALRGFWPMSIHDATGAAMDISGLDHDLTNNHVCLYDYDNLIPYVQFDGVNDYLSHVDHADFDIIGNETEIVNNGLTMGGWFYAETPLVNVQMMGKGAGALATGSYGLQILAVGNTKIIITDAAGAVNEQTTSASVTVAEVWFFAAIQWNPSTTRAVWLNEEKTEVASAIATLQNTAVNFQIGAFGGATIPFPGHASLCWLSASYIPDNTILALFHQQRAMFGV